MRRRRSAEGRRLDALRRSVERALMESVGRSKPGEIREALQYVMRAGGKRVRPVLVLLSCQAVGGRPGDALYAAVAVELLHCFTLVHDDIMDDAPTRRGRATVHSRWGVNRGILSGDVLVGLAYDTLLRTRTQSPGRLAEVLTRGLLDVCEGQSADLRFETADRVSVREYFRMIEMKTSALIRTSAVLGGMVGSASPHRIRCLDEYARRLGRAFQVQDDLLDAVADEQTFGKIVGGDILTGKRTYLLLDALKRAKGKNRLVLLEVLRRRPRRNKASLVRAVQTVYRDLGTLDSARRRIRMETGSALRALKDFPANRGTAMLRWIAAALQNRMV